MYAGVLGIVFGLSEYHGRYVKDYDFVETFRFGWAIAYTFLLCLAAYGLGLPEVPRTLRSRLPTSAAAPLVGALAISFAQLFVGDALLPRFVVFGSAMLLVPWFYAISTVAGAGRSALEQRDRVIVVGSRELESALSAELAANPERPASVVATLTEEQAGSLDERSRPLVEAVTGNRASVLILSGAAQADERIVDQAAMLHESGVRVRTQSLFYEEYLGKIPIADLGRVSLFFDIGEVHRDRFSRFKRLIDLAAGIVGMFALLLVIPFVVLGNLAGNRGRLFYVQDRVGRGGAVFTIYKFRTMAASVDAGTDWTAERDPRVTRFGRFLRVSHLDELPQVWNIVKGDLSLVGPRPEQPHYVAELVQKLPFYDLRHIVRPGLTGWAQVKYGYAGDERDALEKLQYDFHYLRRQSVVFDLRIVGRTVRSILGGGGR
jgi:lipopolysaccharide/colanic/teichoic acid biosynthesis glycosyltransferase